MAKQTINIGATANDGTGDQLRTAFTKANDNFTELYNETDSNSLAITNLTTQQTLNINNINANDSDISALKAGVGLYNDSDCDSNVQDLLNGKLNFNIVPLTDSTYSLGDSDKRFKELWLSGSTIHLGNKALSVDAATGDLVEDQTLLFGEAYPGTGVTHATWKDSAFDVRIAKTATNTIDTLKALKIDDKLLLTSGFTGTVSTAAIESRRDSADYHVDYTHVLFGLNINNPEDSAGGNTQVYSFTAKKFPMKSLRQLPFNPLDATAWTSPAPVNLEDAMNRLAAYVKAQGGTA